MPALHDGTKTKITPVLQGVIARDPIQTNRMQLLLFCDVSSSLNEKYFWKVSLRQLEVRQ
jgi:hypothetical protein